MESGFQTVSGSPIPEYTHPLVRFIWEENSSKIITINNATRLGFTIKFSLAGADTFSSPSNPFLHQASARQYEQEIPLFQPQCSDAQIVRSPFNQLLTDARTLCNVALGLACSPGVFWVGESLFMFVLLLPPSLILWQRKIGESRNSNQALSRAKTFTRPKHCRLPWDTGMETLWWCHWCRVRRLGSTSAPSDFGRSLYCYQLPRIVTPWQQGCLW